MAVWVPWRLRLRTEMQELGGLPGLTPLSWLARQISSRRVGYWILDVSKTSMRRDGDLLARVHDSRALSISLSRRTSRHLTLGT